MALRTYHEGYLSEKLAGYLLSKFSFISQPSTTSDDSTAVDYYCTMFDIVPKEDKNKKLYDLLLPTVPFAVQIKSKWEQDMSKYVEKLDKIKVPFFIGITSKENTILTLYAGIGIPMIYSYIGGKIESRDVSLIAKQMDASSRGTQVSFEYKEGNKSANLYFFKILDIPANYDYKKDTEPIKKLKEVCLTMQNNIAARHRNEFIFDDYNNRKVSFVGKDSLKAYNMNFLDRLAECFGNISLKKKATDEDISKEFNIYEKCYTDLIALNPSWDLPHLKDLYQKAKKDNERNTESNGIKNGFTRDATMGNY